MKPPFFALIEGWETFDEHPDLIHFEGYVDYVQRRTYLEPKYD